MDTLHRMELDGISYLQAPSLVRPMRAAASVSLVETKSQQRPLFQIPAILLTLGLGGLALYASSFAVVGRNMAALAFWQANLPSPLASLAVAASSIGERVEAQ